MQLQTLVAGFDGEVQPPVAAVFFRPLQLLVALQAAGCPYQALPASLVSSRALPPPGWALPLLAFPQADPRPGTSLKGQGLLVFLCSSSIKP